MNYSVGSYPVFGVKYSWCSTIGQCSSSEKHRVRLTVRFVYWSSDQDANDSDGDGEDDSDSDDDKSNILQRTVVVGRRNLVKNRQRTHLVHAQRTASTEGRKSSQMADHWCHRHPATTQLWTAHSQSASQPARQPPLIDRQADR